VNFEATLFAGDGLRRPFVEGNLQLFSPQSIQETQAGPCPP
jgi:hypothetical protein